MMLDKLYLGQITVDIKTDEYTLKGNDIAVLTDIIIIKIRSLLISSTESPFANNESTNIVITPPTINTSNASAP